MIEEVDHIRSEAKERHDDLTTKLAASVTIFVLFIHGLPYMPSNLS